MRRRGGPPNLGDGTGRKLRGRQSYAGRCHGAGGGVPRVPQDGRVPGGPTSPSSRLGCSAIRHRSRSPPTGTGHRIGAGRQLSRRTTRDILKPVRERRAERTASGPGDLLLPLYYRIPAHHPTGQNKALEGDLSVAIETVIGGNADTVRYSVKIVDARVEPEQRGVVGRHRGRLDIWCRPGPRTR